MRLFLSFSLLVLLPAFCRGEEISIAASPDWQAFDQSLLTQRISQSTRENTRILDTSKYVPGAGAGMATMFPVKKGESSQTVETQIAGAVAGLEDGGAKVTDRQLIHIGQLPGVCLAFQGRVKDRDVSGYDYVVFSRDAMYSFDLTGLPGLARTDPLVTSYLARISVDPAAVPGDVNGRAAASPEYQNSYHRARLFGQLLWWIFVLAGLVFLLRKIFGHANRPTGAMPPPLSAPRPPPLPRR